jgi:hypothetical protein
MKRAWAALAAATLGTTLTLTTTTNTTTTSAVPALCTPDTVCVAPDGGITTTNPSPAECSRNSTATIRTDYLNSLNAGLRCLASGGTLLLHAKTATGQLVPYSESGFGTNSDRAVIPSGLPGSPTRIVGVCDSGCKPVIQPTIVEWGVAADRGAVNGIGSGGNGLVGTAAAGSADRRAIFRFERGEHDIVLDNLQLDGSNIGRTAAGDWDGTVCTCFKGFGVAVKYPSQYITIQNFTFNQMEAGVYAAPESGNKTFARDTFVTVQNSSFVKTGRAYKTTQTFRFGDGGTQQNDGYWNHIHSLDFRTGHNRAIGNTLTDDAGSAIQLFVPDATGADSNEYRHNVVTNAGQLAASFGGNTKQNPCIAALNGCNLDTEDSYGVTIGGSNTTFDGNTFTGIAGLRLSYAGAVTFTNNVFNGLRFGRGSQQPLWITNSGGVKFTGNSLCNFAASTAIYVIGPPYQFTQNGQTGNGVTVNSGNTFTCTTPPTTLATPGTLPPATTIPVGPTIPPTAPPPPPPLPPVTTTVVYYPVRCVATPTGMTCKS